MSPELFMEDGVHNFGSDLWSLGCVLYELATGRPPFSSTMLNELMDQIVHGTPDLSLEAFCWRHECPMLNEKGGAPAPSPPIATRAHLWQVASEGPNCRNGCSTAAFAESLRQLLQKDALSRPTWASMHSAESFWSDVLPPPPKNRELPPQPLFQAMIAAQHHQATCRAQQQSTESALASTPAFQRKASATVSSNGVARAGQDRQSSSCRQQKAAIGEELDDSAAEGVLRVSRSYREHLKATAATVHENGVDASQTTRVTSGAIDGDVVDGICESESETNGRGRTLFRDQSACSRPAVEAWWDSPMQFSQVDPQAIVKMLFTTSDAEVEPILSNSATELALRPASWKPCALPFRAKSTLEIRSLPHTELEAHLVEVYQALADARLAVDVCSILAYLHSVCEVAAVANVIVNTSFVDLLLQLVQTRGHECELRHRLLLLIGLLLHNATYIVPIDESEDKLIATLEHLLRDESTDVLARQLALAALGELLLYVTTHDEVELRLSSNPVRSSTERHPMSDSDADAHRTQIMGGCGSNGVANAIDNGCEARLAETAANGERHQFQAQKGRRWLVFFKCVELIATFLQEPIAERAIACSAAKAIGTIFAHASPSCSEVIVSNPMVETLAHLAAPALSGGVHDVADDLPEVAFIALVHLLRSFLGFNLSSTSSGSSNHSYTKLSFGKRDRLEVMIVAIRHLGGPDAIAEGVVWTLANGDDRRWQLVVLNLLNLSLVQRSVTWDTQTCSQLTEHDSSLITELEAQLASAREQLIDDHRVAAALVRAMSGGGCITATIRAKAAIALFQLGVLYLPTLASVIVQSADDSTSSMGGSARNSGLLVALERLATRDVHELQTDAYLASSVFSLLTFVADTARLLTWVLARAVTDPATRADPHALEDVALDSVQTAFDFARRECGEVRALFNCFTTKDRVHEYLWAQLTLSDVAASVLLVTSAISSPLLRPHVITSDLVVDLGCIASALADIDCEGRHNIEDLPTFYILYQTLPSLLDSLVSRDALILLPYTDQILREPFGLIPAVCGLVAGTDHDIRLTAAHLLRHTLPSLLHNLANVDTQATSQHQQARAHAITRLFAVNVSGACARLLAACETDNESIMETQCMLRLLLESIPRFYGVPTALASSSRLILALTSCSEKLDPSCILADLVGQLLRAIHR